MGAIWDLLIFPTGKPDTSDDEPRDEPSEIEPNWRDLERRRVAQAAAEGTQIVCPTWECHHASAEGKELQIQARYHKPSKSQTLHVRGPGTPQARGFTT
jgi:hypothetical protein